MDFEEWFFDEKDNTELKRECENLLQSTGYDDEYKKRMEEDLLYYSEEELNKLKANLYASQVDRIDNGLNYNQTDIKRKLRNYE